MVGRFLKLFSALRCYLVLALLFTAFVPSLSFASACTAMWGIINDGTNTRLAYYNDSAGTASKWSTLSFTLVGTTNTNALAGDSSTGELFYFDRTAANLALHKVNLNTYADTNLGVVPASPVGNTNIIGATGDNSGGLWLMSTSGANGTYYVAGVSKTMPIVTLTSWVSVTYSVGGGTPTSGGSGDLVFSQGGQAYLASNSNPTTVYPLTLATGKVGASVTYAIGALGVAGIGVNPNGGSFYIGGNSTGSITYRIDPTTNNSQVLVDASPNVGNSYAVSDIGNCVTAPSPPTITKSFSPTYAPLTGTTTTLVLAIGNPNTVPIWLNAALLDVLPAGLTIAATPNLSTGLCTASATVTNVITATAGQNTVTFANGGRIPAAGCTITLSVTGAAQTNGYTNTIAVGSLTTTSGSNTLVATATYKIGTDFSDTKTEGTGTAGPYSTGPLTVPGGTTMQYILTVTNSASGGTGSATFTDTLPTLITPVLTITSGLVGGGAGTCVIATSTLAGATQITGTLTNVIAGAVCSITVTTKVSAAQTVATVVTNTFTLAPLAGTSDTNPANNSATVTTTVGASANITISKTNGTTTILAGSTTSYTLTIVNLGPAAAPGSLVTDPVVTGLNCTTVTCTGAGGATCAASPPIGTLVSPGVSITAFPSGSTASFVVTCGVTATGQ